MDSLDRQRRDAAHGPDHEVLTSLHRLLVIDHRTGSGYVYLRESGVARAARRLEPAHGGAAAVGRDRLGARRASRVEVPHVTTANEWAVDVGLEARLSVSTRGYLALRGMRPPMPYLHHGSLL